MDLPSSYLVWLCVLTLLIKRATWSASSSITVPLVITSPRGILGLLLKIICPLKMLNCNKIRLIVVYCLGLNAVYTPSHLLWLVRFSTWSIFQLLTENSTHSRQQTHNNTGLSTGREFWEISWPSELLSTYISVVRLGDGKWECRHPEHCGMQKGNGKKRENVH